MALHGICVMLSHFASQTWLSSGKWIHNRRKSNIKNSLRILRRIEEEKSKNHSRTMKHEVHSNFLEVYWMLKCLKRSIEVSLFGTMQEKVKKPETWPIDPWARIDPHAKIDLSLFLAHMSNFGSSSIHTCRLRLEPSFKLF